MKRLLFFAVAVAVLPLLPLRADDDVARIRKAIDANDYSAVERDASLVLAAHPENTEARALRVAARTNGMLPELDEAEWMTRAYPGDPWSWYARAAVAFHEEDDDALGYIDRAIALAPAPVSELVILRVDILATSRPDDAAAYVDEQIKAFGGDPVLLALRVQTLQWKRGTPAAALQSAKDAALAAIPSHDIRMRRIVSDGLVQMQRGGQAAALLLDAIREHPSASLTSRYAAAIRTDNTLSEVQKDAAVDAVVDPLLRIRGDDPAVLQRVAGIYRAQHREDEAVALERLIVDRDPWSPAAEWVAYDRIIRPAGEQHTDPADPQVLKAQERQYREFVNRPCHYYPAVLQSAYQGLFLRARRDPGLTNDELRSLIRGMVGDGSSVHTQFFAAAGELANRGIDLDEAARLIDLGARAQEKQLAEIKANDDEKMFRKASDTLSARLLDARGWLAFKRGEVAAARRDLEEARKLNAADTTVRYHYGRLLEARGDLAGAEREWARGLGGFGAKSLNDNYIVLTERYKASHGGKLDGFDAYTKSLLPAQDTVTRRTNVLGERVKDPHAVPRFALKTLDGRNISLEDLHGKIAVVNFWGVWCGWCVAELPELQKLATKYANDPKVRILTIGNDGDASLVKRFMAEKKFDFPVLLDDGYVSANGINSFPTTWFLDPQGRIAFNKRGASDKLEEEFTWRIEALK